jgi:hypothetical protein
MNQSVKDILPQSPRSVTTPRLTPSRRRRRCRLTPSRRRRHCRLTPSRRRRRCGMATGLSLAGWRLRNLLQRIRRALDCQSRLVHHVQTDHRRPHVLMAEQFLHRPDIHPVHGPGLAETRTAERSLPALAFWGHIAFDRQIRQKRLDFLLIQLADIEATVMFHEPLDPADIRPLGLQRLSP